MNRRFIQMWYACMIPWQYATCNRILQVAPQKCGGCQILPNSAVKLPGMSGTLETIGRYVIVYLLFYWTFGCCVTSKRSGWLICMHSVGLYGLNLHVCSVILGNYKVFTVPNIRMVLNDECTNEENHNLAWWGKPQLSLVRMPHF